MSPYSKVLPMYFYVYLYTNVMCGSQNELKRHYIILDMLHFSSKVVCYVGILTHSPAKAHCLITSHSSLPWR